MASLGVRAHIQDEHNATVLEQHWGYPSRVLPCTNDAGSCEYLQAVYWMHDISMLYTFILWAAIGGVVITILTMRLVTPDASKGRNSEGQKNTGSAYYRAWRGIRASIRRNLLPESFENFFGNVTRLQLVILTTLLGYLIIFSLVGIAYKTWITPVKNTTLFNTRTGLGGFADRVGALAYALTPLTILLSSRESILTLITGIPYPSFNFMHRWLGRVIFIQSFLHTLGWTLIEGRFYLPQPAVHREFINETYIVWGVIAMLFLTFIIIFSLKSVVRLTGYEFFRKAHYIIAGVYLGACWAHWNRLACWMIASLGIFGLDRAIRLLRTFFIHTGHVDGKGFGFHPSTATLKYFPDSDGGVTRLSLPSPKNTTFSAGQHFFLCFPSLSIWQSHPLTLASPPSSPTQIYLIRSRKGETLNLANLALSSPTATTKVILSGPYGKPLLPSKAEKTNILFIAGGTGVSLTLPVILAATEDHAMIGAAINFVWVIRHSTNLTWISNELSHLENLAQDSNLNLQIHIYITQSAPGSETTLITPHRDEKLALDITATSKPSNYQTTLLENQRPSLNTVVRDFMDTRANADYRTRVIASGPVRMGHDLRVVVASCNHGAKVWKGDRRWDVELEWDDRLG